MIIDFNYPLAIERVKESRTVFYGGFGGVVFTDKPSLDQLRWVIIEQIKKRGEDEATRDT